MKADAGGSISNAAVTAGAVTIWANKDLSNSTATASNGATIKTDTGDISNTTATATGGNVSMRATIGDILDSAVTATTGNASMRATGGNIVGFSANAGGTAMLNASNGKITDTDGNTDITAATAVLSAGTGIYGNSPIETSAAVIDADTASGNIEIDNTGGTSISADIAGNGDIDINNSGAADAVASTLTVGGDGSILFSQSGGGSLTVNTATTNNGNIGIDVTGNDLTASSVTAGGAGSADLDATGSILDSTVVAGNLADLDAIGDILNSNVTAGPLADLTAGGNIGGTDASAGIVLMSAGDSITNSSANAGSLADLTANTGSISSVSATADSGQVAMWAKNDISEFLADAATTATLTASTGKIEDTDGAIDIAGNKAILTASTGIGELGTAIQTDITILNAQTATGDIAIVEEDDVALQDILAEAGSILLEATGGAMTYDSGTIKAGASTLTMIQKDTLNIAEFTFANQGNTDLTLESTRGSTIAVDEDMAIGKPYDGNNDNAADQWKSIGAKANGGVILSSYDSDINARRLEAAHGPIEVDAKGFDLLANDHGFVGDDGILASGGGNITLKGRNVIVDGDIDAHYGFGIRPAGYNSDLTIEADGNIELDGYANVDGGIDLQADTGDINLKGALTAANSGVLIIAKAGKVYTDAGDEFNISVTGYSDDKTDQGVDLLEIGGDGKAAIVILSNDNLILGTQAELTANGEYYGSDPAVDNRLEGNLKNVGENSGDPIDIAVYLASGFKSNANTFARVGSEAINFETEGGTLVVDATHTVAFTDDFISYLEDMDAEHPISRIEVVSRVSETRSQAQYGGLPGSGAAASSTVSGELLKLPYADTDLDAVSSSWHIDQGGYILRGSSDGLTLGDPAFVLTDDSPALMSYVLQPRELEITRIPSNMAAILALLDSLGVRKTYLGQPGEDYVLSAQGLGSDDYDTSELPIKSAMRLLELQKTLKDYEPVVGPLAAVLLSTSDQPPTPELFSSIREQLAVVPDGDTAVAWLAAVTESHQILTEIASGEYTEFGLNTSLAYLNPFVESLVEQSNDERVAMFMEQFVGGML